jgi:hypothetical protein
MNATLSPLLRKCALMFFDDIMIYNNSLEDHVVHLKQVLQLLEQDHWQVKFSKCSFAQGQIDYLGACHLRIRCSHISSEDRGSSEVAFTYQCKTTS